jgi:hypothetical protein
VNGSLQECLALRLRFQLLVLLLEQDLANLYQLLLLLLVLLPEQVPVLEHFD